MALLIKDGNAASQYLPNTGIDPMYFASDTGTITTTATSATDVLQLVGAAGVIARLRRIEIIGAGIIGAQTTTYAAVTTLCRLMRRTTAGTTGTWTALTESGKLGRWGNRTGDAAAASVTVNIAGTTAFTVGSGTTILRAGYVSFQCFAGDATHQNPPPSAMLAWDFGINGNAPVYLVGTSDYLCINLNGVTPIGPLQFNVMWDEATT